MPRKREKIAETKKIGDITFKVRVEGRIPRCYKCGLKSHTRADCSPPRLKDKGKDSEKVVGAPLILETEEKKSEATQQPKASISIKEESTNE